MRRFLPFALLACLALVLPAQAYSVVLTTEVLVLNSAAVAMPQTAGRRAIEIQNNGPNPIYCALGGAAAVVGKGRMIRALGDSWVVPVPAEVPIKCIAGTADQVTTAATIATEVR